jgi:hypothetical protein
MLSRFQPRGLALALWAAALALALVGAFAVTYPNTASPVQIVLLHGILVALFASAAVLFRSSAADRKAA